MPAGLLVAEIAKVPRYFFHGTYRGAQSVVPSNTSYWVSGILRAAHL